MVAHAGNALYYKRSMYWIMAPTSMQWGKNWFNTGVVLTAREIAAVYTTGLWFALPIIGYLFVLVSPLQNLRLPLPGWNKRGWGMRIVRTDAHGRKTRYPLDVPQERHISALHIQRSYFFTHRFELGDAAYQYQD